MSARTVPPLMVLRVVKDAPQVQLTWVSTYSGWMSRFKGFSWVLGRAPGRRAGLHVVNRGRRSSLPALAASPKTGGGAGIFPAPSDIRRAVLLDHVACVVRVARGSLGGGRRNRLVRAQR